MSLQTGRPQAPMSLAIVTLVRLLLGPPQGAMPLQCMILSQGPARPSGAMVKFRLGLPQAVMLLELLTLALVQLGPPQLAMPRALLIL